MQTTSFSECEYRSRLTKIRELMEQKNLQGLFLASGVNHYYISGFPYEWNVPSRPSILIVPLQDEPFLIVHKGIKDVVQEYCWIKNILTYKKRSQAPINEIIESLHNLGIKRGFIGTELAFEQRLDIAIQDFLELQKSLAEIKLVDASDFLLKARAKKSPVEIAQMRQACKITGQAFNEAFTQARAGLTEEEISQLIKIAIIKRGGSDPRMWMTSGNGNYGLNAKGPSKRVIQAGDFLWVDVSCHVNGYWSDFCRAAVVGQPSKQQKETQQRISEITFIGINMVRPGVKVAEIANAVNKAMQDLDIDIQRNISSGASRVGHGIGLSQTEPPDIADYDETELQPGMIFTIEPAIATNYGTFRVEEQVLVTENGCEVLSDTCRDLWVIQ